MKNIPLYPTISKALYQNMNPQLTFDYYFSNNGKIIKLEESNLAKSIIKLEDKENEIWDYIEHGLIIKGKLSLKKPYYYLKSKKIIVKDTVIGVSLLWYSSEAKLRGVKKIGLLDDNLDNETVSFDFELIFERKQLLYNLELEIVFYIEKPGKPYPNEKHIANEKGITLGSFYLHQIQFEGIGSLFPIFEDDKPNESLWDIIINIDDDPFEEQFNDKIRIYINKAHKAYPYIDYNNKETFNKYFFVEVISSAMSTLLMYLYHENFISKLDSRVPNYGSIMHAVKYYIETLGWDCSSFESISRSIRKYFLDKEI